MSAFTAMRLFALFYTLFSGVTALPTTIDARNSVNKRDNSSTTFVAKAPYFTIYNDKWVTLPSVEDLEGYNVL